MLYNNFFAVTGIHVFYCFLGTLFGFFLDFVHFRLLMHFTFLFSNLSGVKRLLAPALADSHADFYALMF